MLREKRTSAMEPLAIKRNLYRSWVSRSISVAFMPIKNFISNKGLKFSLDIFIFIPTGRNRKKLRRTGTHFSSFTFCDTNLTHTHYK
jgi:hypothetical protein